MPKYIIAHDVGTSVSKAVLVDTGGQVHGSCSETYPVHYPRPGWAEQQPEDFWGVVTRTTRTILEKSSVEPEDILCVTFSTQMLGIIPMSPQNIPLRPAIIWLDNRAGSQADRIMRKFISPGLFAAIAGAKLCGKDGLPKLLWLKEEEPQIYQKMHCFLDVGGYLLFRSTGKLAMDWTEGSVFALDLKKKAWLETVIKYIGLDPKKFPPLLSSVSKVGTLTAEAAKDYGLLQGTPVIAGAGDAPCAAVGAGAVGEGDGHIYLGTSGWVAVVTERMPTGKCGIAAIHSADPTRAFLFAESETAGACLQWIADQFYKAEKLDPNIPNVYALMDDKVGEIPPGSGHLLFTPWLYGERAPVADCYVRSSFLNMSAEHSREHLLRAVYEGVAYNIRWIVEIIENEFKFPLPVLRAIGGGARGGPWMQIIADVTNRQIESVHDPQEAGAVGVALVAAVGLGMYPDFTSLKNVVKVEKVFEPNRENLEIYDSLFHSYKEAYSSLRNFYIKLNKQRIDSCI